MAVDSTGNHALAALVCTMSATTVAFGNVDTTSAGPADATATLSLNCTGAPSFRTIRMCVDINGGTAFDATSRKMTSGGNQLRYQLYSNSARTTPWGSWSAGLYGGGLTWDVFCFFSACNASRTIYGRVTGGQTSVPAGSYSSSLGLTFTYNDSSSVACPNPGDGNSSASFAATATVAPTCRLNATDLNFGTAGFLLSPIDSTNTVSVTCTSGTPYQLGLNAGSGAGATVAARKMTKLPTANTVTYCLYRNAARSQIWGTTIGSDTRSGTGTGLAQSFTVYGRVPSQTTPPAGVYTDTIIATVTY
jgi:spore coat protein U-like protein